MYQQFFGFDAAPFANVPDPQFLFMSAQHQRALATLQYALQSGATFCLITGHIGAGKTTLVRRVLQTLGDQFQFGLVSNTSCATFEELLRWILLSFDLDYRGKNKVEMYEQLVEWLIDRHRAGQRVALIIDEAQNLGVELLEQLRMLSNVNSERGSLLQIVLAGQPELRDLLQDSRLAQFAQRIGYDFFLQPLDGPDVVRQYVIHRLRVAGGREDLFEPDTFALIAEASRGIPRLINLVCDHALVHAFGMGEARVGRVVVTAALAGLQRSFLPVASIDAQATAPAVLERPQESETEPLPECKVQPVPESNAEPDAESGPDAESEPDTESLSEIEPEPCTEPESALEPESDAEADANAEAEAIADAGTSVEAEAEPPFEPQPQAVLPAASAPGCVDRPSGPRPLLPIRRRIGRLRRCYA